MRNLLPIINKLRTQQQKEITSNKDPLATQETTTFAHNCLIENMCNFPQQKKGLNFSSTSPFIPSVVPDRRIHFAAIQKF